MGERQGAPTRSAQGPAPMSHQIARAASIPQRCSANTSSQRRPSTARRNAASAGRPSRLRTTPSARSTAAASRPQSSGAAIRACASASAASAASSRSAVGQALRQGAQRVYKAEGERPRPLHLRRLRRGLRGTAGGAARQVQLGRRVQQQGLVTADAHPARPGQRLVEQPFGLVPVADGQDAGHHAGPGTLAGSAGLRRRGARRLVRRIRCGRGPGWHRPRCHAHAVRPARPGDARTTAARGPRPACRPPSRRATCMVPRAAPSSRRGSRRAQAAQVLAGRAPSGDEGSARNA